MGLAPAIDLTADQRRIVLSLLRRHLPNTVVWAYGSRVKWTSGPASDLDLVAFATPAQSPRIAELREAFDESALPFSVDLFVWDDVPKDFRKRIDAEHVVLAGKEHSPCVAWPTVKLGDCASLVGDRVDPAHCGELPYIGLEHIGQGTLSLLGNGTAADVESTKTAFRAGDILFGKLRPYFRKVVRPDFDGICSTDIWAVRPKAGVDAGFLFYLMASEAFVDFASQGSEGTRMPRAKWDHVANYPVRLPPMIEQRAIARTLDTLSDKIELNRSMMKTSEEVLRTLFKAWFVDSAALRLDGGKDQNAAAWSVKPIDALCRIVGGTTPSTRVDEYWRDGLHCWATPRDLARLTTEVLIDTDRKVTDAGLQKIGSGLLPQGSVLMSSRAPIGHLAVSDVPVCVNQGFIALVPHEGISSYFLLNWCRFHLQDILNVANGSTFLEVSKRDFRKLQVMVPSDAAMSNFRSVANRVHTRVAGATRESMMLVRLRDGLLPRLLSGEFQISVAEEFAVAAT